MLVSAGNNRDFLKTPIEFLKGVGASRAEMLRKELGIFTFNDLLFHFPFRHVDRSKIYTCKEIEGELTFIQLKGVISNMKVTGTKRSQRLIADFRDSSGKIELIWFQGIKWIMESIKPGKEYLVFGKPAMFQGQYNIPHPIIDDPADAENRKYLKIMPFYPVTERMKAKGLDSRMLMRLTNTLLTDSRFDISEILPADITSKYQLVNRKQALIQIHFPDGQDKLNEARKRLKFEELFFIQLRLLRFKTDREKLFNGIKFESIGEHFNTFYNNYLPFELTGAQKRVIKEIRADVKSGRQMNRLLQGDVGSGKTIVALLVMLMAIDNGYQTCMMAPTEILAQQHFTSVSELLKEMSLKVGLLTGSTTAKERKKLLEEVASGQIDILIGTHALIEEIVQFKNLGMAIIDEQHRFGVAQRARLWKKNTYPPHMLVMTATPIPRTLAMTLYGDLDVSMIDELPKGRKPISTSHKYDANRLAVYGFMKKEIEKGRQVYVVYPLIEESEKKDYMNLQTGYEEITRNFPQPEYNVCMVHGKMKSADKDREMARFVNGEAQIMVATTVIEVGVNVPNASVMIIESAERFGLSQLHQLRGRVGRGADQSYCVLMTGYKLSNEGKLRLKTMCETSNGFEIAEVDLRLRGPGEMEGTQQSGVLDLRIADISKDQHILQEARHAASELLHKDQELTLPEHREIKNYFAEYNKFMKWGRIS